MNNSKFKIEAKDVSLGESKIGGGPDLKENSVYPTTENGFYEFVAQLNFEELEGVSQLLPQKGMISLFVGSISQSQYHFIYYPSVPNNLNRIKIPSEQPFLGDTDYSPTKSGKLLKGTNIKTEYSVIIANESYSYKDPIFLKLNGYTELETNILFDYKNNFAVRYFGRISGHCEIDQLLNSEEECFQLGDLTYGQWKDKLISFDKRKDILMKKYHELICLISIPTNYDIGMVWGDMLRVEFFIMKEDLLNKQFERMIVKYAPD